MKKSCYLFYFLFYSFSFSLFADQRGNGGVLLDQSLAHARRELIESFKKFTIKGLDHFSKKWWETELEFENKSLPRYSWMPIFLEKAKIVTGELPCQTELGAKSACQNYDDEGNLIIYLQSQEWESENLYSLKAILIHEVGHALNEEDHGTLSLLATEFLDIEAATQEDKRQENQLDSHTPKTTKILNIILFGHYDEEKNIFGGTLEVRSPLIQIDNALARERLYVLSTKAKVNFLSADTDFQIRTGGAFTYNKYPSEMIGGMTPINGIFLGYNGKRINSEVFHQFHFINFSFFHTFAPNQNDFITFDGLVALGFGPAYSDGMTGAVNVALDVMYLHTFSDSFALGLQYIGDYSHNLFESYFFEHDVRGLMTFDQKGTFMLVGGLKQLDFSTKSNKVKQIGINVGVQLRF
jgi:hypothetical protein